MKKYYISYERNNVGQGIVVEASDEKVAKEYFVSVKPDANVWGVREATYSEVHKPGMSVWTVPKEFEEAYNAKLNSKTEYPVYLVSEGGTKKEFTVCDTEQEAKDFCDNYDWEYKDENDFVWGMEYDEREKEKPSLDAMMEQAAGRISKAETSKNIAKETELQRD